MVEVALMNGASRYEVAESPRAWMEPSRVEVAVELELSAPDMERPPFVRVRWPKIEEDASETNPPFKVERPETERVEEAEREPRTVS